MQFSSGAEIEIYEDEIKNLIDMCRLMTPQLAEAFERFSALLPERQGKRSGLPCSVYSRLCPMVHPSKEKQKGMIPSFWA